MLPDPMAASPEILKHLLNTVLGRHRRLKPVMVTELKIRNSTSGSCTREGLLQHDQTINDGEVRMRPAVTGSSESVEYSEEREAGHRLQQAANTHNELHGRDGNTPASTPLQSSD
jgi:hypothetical protein